MLGKFPPPNFPQLDLGRRADSRWALPQISSFIYNKQRKRTSYNDGVFAPQALNYATL